MDINRRGFLKGIIGLGLIAGISDKNILDAKDKHTENIEEPKNKKYIELYVANGGTYVMFPEISKMTTAERAECYVGLEANKKSILYLPAILTDFNGGYKLSIALKPEDIRAYVTK